MMIGKEQPFSDKGMEAEILSGTLAFEGDVWRQTKRSFRTLIRGLMAVDAEKRFPLKGVDMHSCISGKRVWGVKNHCTILSNGNGWDGERKTPWRKKQNALVAT